jgi:hypothetical protein
MERNQLAKEGMEARVSCTIVLLIEFIYPHHYYPIGAGELFPH